MTHHPEKYQTRSDPVGHRKCRRSHQVIRSVRVSGEATAADQGGIGVQVGRYARCPLQQQVNLVEIQDCHAFWESHLNTFRQLGL